MKTSSLGRSVGRSSTLFCLCALILSGAGCDTLVWEDPPGSARDGHRRLQATVTGGTDSPAIPSSQGIFFTTVEFPQGYNWRRDTLYGSVDARVCLYRDGEQIMQVPTGVLADAAADLHHFVGGHLYTECRSGGVTTLACDGQLILQFQGEEILKGIVPMQDVLYTLWQGRGEQGFCLRCGEEEILRRAVGTVSGSLQDHSYLPYGALFPYGESILFCYHDNDKWFYVNDGREFYLNVPKEEILDVKYIDGNSCAMFIDSGSGKAAAYYSGAVFRNLFDAPVTDDRSGRIYDCGGLPALVCNINTSKGTRTAVGFPLGKATLNLPTSGCIPLSLSGTDPYFWKGGAGSVTVATANGTRSVPGEYFLFGVSPGICTEGKTILALNSRGEDKNPVLWRDGEIYDLEINGFISGVYSDSQ